MTLPNPASERLHEAMGFADVGVYRHVGHKLGAWRDVRWYQRPLRAGEPIEVLSMAELFADPAWDMLLDLLQAEIVQHRVPVSSLCIAAAVPATTALRWIKSMTDRGLLVRRDDPHDGRRVFIEMAPATSAGLRRYFQEVGMAAV